MNTAIEDFYQRSVALNNATVPSDRPVCRVAVGYEPDAAKNSIARCEAAIEKYGKPTDSLEFACKYGLDSQVLSHVIGEKRRAIGVVSPATTFIKKEQPRRVRIVSAPERWAEFVGREGVTEPVAPGAGVSMIKVRFDDGDFNYFKASDLENLGVLGEVVN